LRCHATARLLSPHACPRVPIRISTGPRRPSAPYASESIHVAIARRLEIAGGAPGAHVVASSCGGAGIYRLPRPQPRRAAADHLAANVQRRLHLGRFSGHQPYHLFRRFLLAKLLRAAVARKTGPTRRAWPFVATRRA